jgi:CRP-like cAMP-binding protein
VFKRNSKARNLKRVAFFADCSAEDLETVSDRMTEVDVAAGTEVVKEGDEAADFYVIVSGTADVLQGDALIGTIGPGDCFGEVAILLHIQRSATVRASSPMHLLVSDGPGFFDLIHETRGLHAKVIDAMAERRP